MPLSTTVTRSFFDATTARTTSYLDMLKTIATLLVLGALLAAVPLALGLVSATLAGSLTVYGATLAMIVAGAVFNYCFAAQFTQVSLSAKPIEDNKKDGILHINFRELVSTLIEHANKKPGVKQLPTDLLIAHFRDEHNIRLTSVSGINVDACAIFIPSAISQAHSRKLIKPEVTALLMLEVIKIRNAHTRRGFLNTISNMGLAFLSLLQDLDRSPYLTLKLIGALAGPLKFVFLFQTSRNRTYQYEAMQNLIEECGPEYGQHFKNAYNKLGLPWDNSVELPVQADLTKISKETAEKTPVVKIALVAKPKKAFFSRMHKACANWILQVAKSIKEVFSDYPAANNTLKFIDEQIVKNASVPTPAVLMLLNTPSTPKPPKTAPVSSVAAITPPVAANDAVATPKKLKLSWFGR